MGQEGIKESDQYGTTAMHDQLRPLMRDFDALMKKNDIRYALTGGTLIGAVRDGGFIPWDDDLDIMVDRENYIKLLRLFHHPKQVGNLKIFDRLWIFRIARRGQPEDRDGVPTLDVFVLDHFPKSRIKKKIKILLSWIMQGMMHTELKLEGMSLPYRICLVGTYYFGKLFTQKFKLRLFDRIMQLWNEKDGPVGCFTDLFGSVPVEYESDVMDHLTECEFEGMKLPIPVGYHNFLYVRYGDYMTPPEQEDRVPIHLGEN